MSKIDNESLERVKDFVQKSYAISSVLVESSNQNGYQHQAIAVEVIEEFLEKALDILKKF